MRRAVIHNPASGPKRDRGALEEAVRSLGGPRVLTTREPGDAGAFARALRGEGIDQILVAGGDGTIHEVVNGLAPDFAGVAVGILPFGTANDLARLAGAPEPPARAGEWIREARPVAFDVVRVVADDVGERHFLNVATGGVSTTVGREVDRTTKGFWGVAAYVVSRAKVLPELESYALTIRLGEPDPETIQLDALNVVVANGRFAGGGIPVAPWADPCDGLLDVVVFPEMPVAELALCLGRLIGPGSVEDGNAAGFVHRRAREVRLEARRSFPLHADGEAAGGLPADYEVLPGRLTMLVGQDAPPGRVDAPSRADS